MSDYQREAMNLIINERNRQDVKWGKQSHSYPLWRIILGEELGEADKEYLEYQFGNEKDRQKLLKELVQVSAVSVAILETLLEFGIDKFVGKKIENEANEQKS